MKPALRITLLHALFGWLNLSLTAPSIYMWLGLPLIMRQHGWSGMDIGLFQLAGLPALFKFALALPVERLRGTADASTQRYRPWAIALCLLLAALMALLALALAVGVAASLAFGLMMYFARPGHSAADYGVQASLFAAGRMLVPLEAGALLDQGCSRWPWRWRA